ncbi:MAG: DUF2971 domain-containing protein [Vicingaceae bacterium]
MTIAKIPKDLRSSDKVFHYTSTDSLIKILKNISLKFSHRDNSLDPIENLKTFYTYSDKTNALDSLLKNKKTLDLIKKECEELEGYCKQICFCKNSDITKANEYEFYGFSKPRMWDQYANGYKGACLIFSRKAIESELEKGNYESNDIEYIKYSSLRRINESLSNDYDLLTFKEYKTRYITKFKRKFFVKHYDYFGENEFRILSFKKETSDFLDITQSLTGIILSENDLNKGLVNYIKNKVSKLGVDVYLLKFGKSDLNFRIK